MTVFLWVIMGLITVIMFPICVHVNVYVGRKAWLKAEIDFFEERVKDDREDKEVDYVERSTRTPGTPQSFSPEIRGRT